MVMACGCLSSLPVYKGPGTSVTSPVGLRQRGVASYYGEAFHGRKTANGEVFDMHALTCAHRTLPFGTMVEVTNLDNGNRVTVRVNDRGPYVSGRIIDLTVKAARELGMIDSGIAKVMLTIRGRR
ncbi:septal ring lytic transglycosylase RlpA family protein [Candidatus Fermentibacteria bacterium]|nr:septal ring lytic transglycosylase RlpA family protein [Candidatus Fermentibacteria bacterium]